MAERERERDHRIIRTCQKCGFILGTRPGLKEENGICLACLNQERKKTIDWTQRQTWLTEYLAKKRSGGAHDCAVAVSGGKDSHTIVKRLMEEHGARNPLLICMADEFTSTQAGLHNRKNIAAHFDLDMITIRPRPKEVLKQIREEFCTKLNPLATVEKNLYQLPIQLAQSMGISTIFFGENAAFEYGSSQECAIFSPLSNDKIDVLYFGAIWPYSTEDSLREATSCGFKSLDAYGEWFRQGNIENFTQIDSLGYLVHIWCKFPKFGFQRVSDIACRFVREGKLTRDQAMQYIRDRDYQLDPAAKDDFCRTVGLTEKEFDKTVAVHANHEIVVCDVNNIWRRRDLVD